ncbi:BTAD domain-containing putative transcriptional regulator [Amycolatopsis sp. NPDC049868]|uniref:AfsR/SARP family transcriptional regulator n=1 Tax=Amycolatopsis sp. NPDC049868 TaxID=3363934 RepID=UPI0037BDE4E2
MEFRVLGPLEVVADGAPRSVGAGRQRAVLAALLLHPNRVVSIVELIDMVWGESAPRSAAVNLRTHVAGLRRVLAPEGEHRMVARGGGYLISVQPGEVDLSCFEDLVAQGRHAQQAGEHVVAVQRFETALSLWRGQPFDNVELHGAAVAEAARLTEIRLSLTAEHLGARLAAGDGAVVEELRGLVVTYPLQEPLWALLMRALYRTGRQVDALAAYDQARDRLAEDLGIDAGTELRTLRQQILTSDPALLDEGGQDRVEITASGSPSPSIAPGRPLSSFLGREAELRTLTLLLDERRLVTVVGPAGVGKTRLVVEYLTGRASWLVRLADVGQEAVVSQAVADAVGLIEVAGDPRQTLVRALAAQHGLLVLDNCEHLTDAVAELVAALLTGCPQLRILTTSREPLNIDGETTLPVAPLPTETGVALLIDRVRTIRPSWTPTPGELRHATRVCEALDGLPLAIELAAARARVLGLDEIAEVLADRFAALAPVPRGSLTPHATLHEAIAWSIEPLSTADRALLLRLWPFEGGFSLTAAQAVGTCDPGAVFTSLSSLISRSVIMADTTTTPTRYRMLETIRAYLRSTDPEPAATCGAHAAWVRAFAAECVAELGSRHSGRAVAALQHEWPNLRAGINHDLAHQPVAALRTAGLLDWFWARSGHITESRNLLGAALRAATGASTVDRARALTAVAGLAQHAGHEAQGRRHSDEAFAVIGDRVDDEHQTLRGRALYYRALARLHTGEINEARAAAEEAITIGQQVPSDWFLLGARMTLGAALAAQGHLRSGEEILAEAVRLARQSDMYWFAGWSELELGRSLLRHATTEDQVSNAADTVQRAIACFQREAAVDRLVIAMHVCVDILLRTGQPTDAATLQAAILNHADQLGMRRDSVVRAGSGSHETELAKALTPTQRMAAEAHGASLSWTDMTELAAAASPDDHTCAP